jgi:hypothetical protein
VLYRKQIQRTGSKYNVLRVIAAFPLGVDFNSASKKVQKTLKEDNHPLASLPGSVLTSALATMSYAPSIFKSLIETLKRKRGEVIIDEELNELMPEDEDMIREP